ncbi:MAG: 3'(2'),5'-bisphosphate nucleotidase CysQ [Acidimicrobiia bacterium]|nr:3'(2'),5'-bisphosphate nucleotidase CysQ [Acidimicrobiia bacterium]MXZ86346.1 3'(2'),5'-bisphosphate nucleotidase CysQ [Acidimicrobiia bacterium]MYB73032.1 3'(2'),5'-bisphosphate nucleotidase CysQ [Acidimicrobiia bacterium]MYG73290.1 3'(2'),5'-bisphosphate nucleotidase CysQ [Acidimicrobiia bacterium]MYI00149.1 3'(2'),5'-bisphosphate nucleotidase CysQ [Acidimicrobiia bacterium]
MSRADDLERISEALSAADEVLKRFTPGEIASELKDGGDPLTAADTAVNDVLAKVLRGGDEGWLSEETTDAGGRLDRRRVWVVDPIDGTREFIDGIPEWCVSVGLVEDGVPVAGGVLSPPNGNLIIGSDDTGVMCNGQPAGTTATTDIRGALVLASRSEVKRGEWERFFSTPIAVRNMGSVAYKLSLVGAGLADATWTLVPKNEWDVAGGAALVRAGGGRVFGIDGADVVFNRADPLMDGFIAVAPGLCDQVMDLLEIPPRP